MCIVILNNFHKEQILIIYIPNSIQIKMDFNITQNASKKISILLKLKYLLVIITSKKYTISVKYITHAIIAIYKNYINTS